jgi:hypothetical protein
MRDSKKLSVRGKEEGGERESVCVCVLERDSLCVCGG